MFVNSYFMHNFSHFLGEESILLIW